MANEGKYRPLYMKSIEKKPRVKAVGCFLQHGGQFLILHRTPKMNQGGKWGLPAGKVEAGESEGAAVIREVREETGFLIPSGKLKFLKKIVFDFPEKVLEYFVYRVPLESKIEVVLDPQEHQACAWTTGKEFYARDDLIEGVHTVLEKTGHTS